MKKTIDISLAGILFHVEEDAYEKLNKYLKSVRNSLSGTDDIDEVMHEIEARIAELLLQKQSHPQQVINNENINEIISVMGQPEDYEVNENTTISQNPKIKKSLFRDMDKSVLGGVAAGLAHYIGMDVTLMRLLFIILLFVTHGSFILIYLLLWIVIPKAKTASDKLKMKGESVNVDNIVEQVSAEEESAKKKIKIGETVENTTHEAGKIFTKLVGLFIALVTGSILLGLLISIITLTPLSGTKFIINNGMAGNISISPEMINLLLGVVIGLPIALVFLSGIKMLFPNTKSINTNILIVAGTIWFLSLLYLSSQVPWNFKNNAVQSIQVEEMINWQTQKDTLYIDTQPLISEIIKDSITDNRIYYKFYPSKDSLFHYQIYKRINSGIKTVGMKISAGEIDYKYQTDSLQNRWIFAQKMSYPEALDFGEKEILIKIYIPENKYVHVDKIVSSHTKKAACKRPEIMVNRNQKLQCLSQYPHEIEDEKNIKISGENLHIQTGINGVHIYARDDNNEKALISVGKNGVEIKAQDENGESAQIKIDKNGIRIKTNENEQ